MILSNFINKIYRIGGVFLIWVIIYRIGTKSAGGTDKLKPTNLNVHFK